MNELIIRKAVPDDTRAIEKLWRAMMAFHEQRDPLFTISKDASDRFIEFINTNMTDDAACVLAAVLDGMVVGYCLGRLEKLPPVFGTREIGSVYDLAVGEAYRRQGVGKKLYREIEAWFKGRGVQRIDVRVATSNEVSTAFWNVCGFNPYVMVAAKRI